MGVGGSLTVGCQVEESLWSLKNTSTFIKWRQVKERGRRRELVQRKLGVWPTNFFVIPSFFW